MTFCTAVKKDGQPCHGVPDASGRCPAHREGFHEIAVKGGKSKSLQARLAARTDPQLKRILDLLSQAVGEVHTGKLEAAKGQAMASLANALIKTNEHSELDARLRGLEQRWKEYRRGTK